jgi:hypothetical protein
MRLIKIFPGIMNFFNFEKCKGLQSAIIESTKFNLSNCHPMISPMVPITLMTQYKYPMGHYSHSFEPKNGKKKLKNIFFGNAHLCNILFYTQIIWLGAYF